MGSTVLNAEYGATLDCLSPDTWRAHWSKEGVNYYLSNFDGASEAAITAAAELLMGKIEAKTAEFRRAVCSPKFFIFRSNISTR